MEYYKNLDLADIKYFCEIDLIEKIELWKDVFNYEGLYEASDLGRIKSKTRYVKHNYGGERVIKERIMKQHKNSKNKYLYLCMCNKGVIINTRVNRIIAISFIENPLNLPVVNHIDLVKTNNMVRNLEWTTSLGNSKHNIENGKSGKGEFNNTSKLTEKEVLEIRASSLRNIDLSKIYNVTSSLIGMIKRRETWKHI